MAEKTPPPYSTPPPDPRPWPPGALSPIDIFNKVFIDATPWSGSEKEFLVGKVPAPLKDVFLGFWEATHRGMPGLIADALGALIAGLLAFGAASVEALAPLIAEIDLLYEKGKQEMNKKDPVTLLPYETLAELRRRFPNAKQFFEDHLTRAGFGPTEVSALAELLTTLTPDATIIEAYRRNFVTEEQARQQLLQKGYTAEAVTNMLSVSFTLLDATNVLTLWLRGHYSDEQSESYLSDLGYSGDDIPQLKKLTQVIPGVADLVMMAVKEAFNPEQIKLLDLDQEFPPDFGKYAKQQGLSEEWAHHYWQAHWQLPSPTATYEMHHRTTDVQVDPTSPVLGYVNGKPYYRLISGETLGKLLKAQDYAPTWREKLQAISFNLLTRVDIERMYALGIMSEEEVYRAYIDDGYTELNARRLTDFVVSDTTRSAIGSILTDLQGKYVEGVATEDELRSYFLKAKWAQWRVDVLVDGLKLKRQLRVREHIVMAIKRQYFEHLIEDGLMLVTLTTQGVPADAALLLFQEWKVERETLLSRLRITDVAKAYAEGLITKEKLETMLKHRHFPPEDIALFEKLHAPKPPPT